VNDRAIEQRKRMCTSKRLYTFEQSAQSAARESTKAFKKPCRAYKCPSCGWWHITSQPKRDAG
jgi:hypothetical protein